MIDTFADAQANAGTVINDRATPCFAGYYCKKNSYKHTTGTHANKAGLPCPVGTFNPDIGARSVGDCITCPEGYLCTVEAIDTDYATLTQCTAGSYCPGAAISKSAITCPVGAYCPQKSVTFTQCPAGTYRDTTGATVVGDCTTCDANYYCASRGMTSAGKTLCGDGYECTGGTTVGSPLAA